MGCLLCLCEFRLYDLCYFAPHLVYSLLKVLTLHVIQIPLASAVGDDSLADSYCSVQIAIVSAQT